MKKQYKLLNNQKRGGLAWVPKNLGTLCFFPGDEQLDKPGLIQSDAGYLLGENLISRLGASFCLNNHLNGFSI